MDGAVKGSMSVFVSYIKSLTELNPSWNFCNDDVQEKTNFSSTFSDLLDNEYYTAKNLELQRSDKRENSLFHELSNPYAHGPLKIEFSSSFGRYLVATRDIAAGEVIFRERPVILTPKSGIGETCIKCLKSLARNNWEECRGCGAPLCISSCAGVFHSNEECRIVARLRLQESENEINLKLLSVLLTPLRTLIFIQQNKFIGEVVASLQSNIEIRKKLPIGRFIEDKVTKTLQSQMSLDVESDIVHHICGVFDTNAFDITLDDCRRARALFPLAALMNHACLPNTQHWYSDGVMTVRAVTDISCGESVTNTYTPILLSTKCRASILATTKLFQCTCQRCLDPTELNSHINSVICQGCPSGEESVLVPPAPCDSSSDWKCQSCENTLSNVAVETMLKAASLAMSRIPSNDTEALSSTLDHFSKLLGKNQYIILEIKYALMLAIMQQPLEDITDEDLVKVIRISEDLLQVASLIDPGLSRFRGLVLLEKLRASAERLRRQKRAEGFKSKHSQNNKDLSEEESDSRKVKELLTKAAECEFILQYDPKGKDAMLITNALRNFV